MPDASAGEYLGVDQRYGVGSWRNREGDQNNFSNASLRLRDTLTVLPSLITR